MSDLIFVLVIAVAALVVSAVVGVAVLLAQARMNILSQRLDLHITELASHDHFKESPKRPS